MCLVSLTKPQYLNDFYLVRHSIYRYSYMINELAKFYIEVLKLGTAIIISYGLLATSFIKSLKLFLILQNIIDSHIAR